MKKWLVLMMAGMMVFATSASAEQYVTGKIGAYFPEADYAFDMGLNLRAALGKTIVEAGKGDVNAEIGIGYYSPGEKNNGFSLNVIPLTATAIYNMPFPNSPIEFYGGAGLGLYYWWQETSVIIPFFGEIGSDIDGLDLGINLVGGALFNVNEKFGISAELEYDLVTDDVGGLFLNVGAKYRF